MSGLAVVGMLNSVPPGAPVPEGGVLFAMPAAVTWLIVLGFVATSAWLARWTARLSLAWWRRVRRQRRSAPQATVEALGLLQF